LFAEVVTAMTENRLDPVLRTALSWSCRTLDANTAALFRRLGLHARHPGAVVHIHSTDTTPLTSFTAG
jgi:hypothetical protein